MQTDVIGNDYTGIANVQISLFHHSYQHPIMFLNANGLQYGGRYAIIQANGIIQASHTHHPFFHIGIIQHGSFANYVITNNDRSRSGQFQRKLKIFRIWWLVSIDKNEVKRLLSGSYQLRQDIECTPYPYLYFVQQAGSSNISRGNNSMAFFVLYGHQLADRWQGTSHPYSAVATQCAQLQHPLRIASPHKHLQQPTLGSRHTYLWYACLIERGDHAFQYIIFGRKEASDIIVNVCEYLIVHGVWLLF